MLVVSRSWQVEESSHLVSKGRQSSRRWNSYDVELFFLYQVHGCAQCRGGWLGGDLDALQATGCGRWTSEVLTRFWLVQFYDVLHSCVQDIPSLPH